MVLYCSGLYQDVFVRTQAWNFVVCTSIIIIATILSLYEVMTVILVIISYKDSIIAIQNGIIFIQTTE